MPQLIYGFKIDARLGNGDGGVFGVCFPEQSEYGRAYEAHIVGYPMDLETLLHGYIPKRALEYGRVMWQTLGIKCSWLLACDWADEDDTKMISSLEFVKSWKKEWTRKQCENAIKIIQEVTGYSESEEHVRGKRIKKSEDEKFEKFKKFNYLSPVPDEKKWSLDEERAKNYVPFSLKELEEYTYS